MKDFYAEVLEVQDLVCGTCGVELDMMDPWRRWGRRILHPGCLWIYMCFQGPWRNLLFLIDLLRFWTSRRYRRAKRRYERWKRLRSAKQKAEALEREPILAFSPLTRSSFIPHSELLSGIQNARRSR